MGMLKQMNDEEGKILTGKEAEDEIARQFRELEARDRTATNNNGFTFNEPTTTKEESEGERLLYKVIDDKNARIHKRNETIKLRGIANKQLFEIIEMAKWADARAFAFAISVLKDDAKDERVRIAAKKAFQFILEQMKRFKIDDDRLMIEIDDIRHKWETQIKQPWDIRSEILRDKIIDLDKEIDNRYSFL